MTRRGFALASLCALLSGCASARAAPSPKPAPPVGKRLPASASATSPPARRPHVVLVVEENRSASAVLGSASAPYVNALAGSHGVATAAYGQAHPSLPNYLELLSGSTHGVRDDGTGYRFGGQTLAGQLSAAGIGWRAYMEELPSPCFTGAQSGEYAKKHDPFVYFSSILDSPAQCDSVVPYARLAADLRTGSLPQFVWITPNLCDDGHDCSTAHMDAWLHANLQPILSSSWFAQDGVAIVTWDEGESDAGCCAGAHGGPVATVVVAAQVQAHRTSGTAVDHAGVLRTIETLFSLPYLGDAACGCSGDLMALVSGADGAAVTAHREG